MELRYPFVLWIGLAVLAAAVVFLYRTRNRTGFSGGVKVSTAALYENDPEFKKAKRLAGLLKMLTRLSLCGMYLSAVILAAAPYETREQTTTLRQRDIFFCLDVSYSIYELNDALVDQLKELTEGLEGDRLGISIYNTSTILYVPLSDDYTFIQQKLDELKEYFSLQKQLMAYEDKFWLTDREYEEYEKIYDQLDFYDAGTVVNNRERGSSLIGEGLASCMYSFPELDESERTRVIVMTTDNDERAIAEPVVELDEAAALAASHDISIFGIFPDRENYDQERLYMYDQNQQDFRECISQTGGKVYEVSRSLDVDAILEDIQKDPAMQAAEVTTEYEVDLPQIPFICLMVSFIMYVICRYVRFRGVL